MFFKSHSVACYGMLSFAMVWYGVYGMLWDVFAILRYLYAMLIFVCYAMVYVVKERHSYNFIVALPPTVEFSYI